MDDFPTVRSTGSTKLVAGRSVETRHRVPQFGVVERKERNRPEAINKTVLFLFWAATAKPERRHCHIVIKSTSVMILPLGEIMKLDRETVLPAVEAANKRATARKLVIVGDHT